jgi:dephospho-CoA kinase
MSATTQHPQTDFLVIGVSGRIGAGKTSAAQYLSSTYDFQYIRYSQVLSGWLGNPETKSGLQEIGWQVMNGGKQAELNRWLLAQITPDKSVAVDGLRHPVDHESLAKKFGSSFHLLYIDTARETRWMRLTGRARYQTPEEFEAADSHPVEQQIESLRPKAETVLRNEGSLEELHASLDIVIRNLTLKGSR